MAKIYRYYCLYRPPGLNAVPRNFIGAIGFEQRRYCPEVDRQAWGYVEYDRPLTPQEIVNYELAVVQR